MNDFTPNAFAVAGAARALLAPQFGAKPTAEDAAWLAAQKAALCEPGSNGHKFWLAVHDAILQGSTA